MAAGAVMGAGVRTGTAATLRGHWVRMSMASDAWRPVSVFAVSAAVARVMTDAWRTVTSRASRPSIRLAR